VILTGSVAWDSQRRAAEKQVRQIKGVHWVDDRVTLAPRVSSFEAHQHITDALKRNALTDAAQIDVAVDGTRVTLTGTVASYDEFRQAERAAWSSPHVTEVRNDLTVQPR
jgi:osmotically-inducible protein OsmY